MEHDQRVIIKFRWNEETDAQKIRQRLQGQYYEEADALRIVQSCIGELHRDSKQRPLRERIHVNAEGAWM
jgi:hypothetical protein